MQTRLLSQVYGLVFLLMIAGAMFHSVWKRSKRQDPRAGWQGTTRTTLRYFFRLGVTSAAAFVIALTVLDDDSGPLLWIVLWVVFYWLWKFWDRYRGKAIAHPTDSLIPAPTALASEPQMLPDRGPRRPLWRRAVRKTLTLTAGAFAFIALMGGVMTLCLNYYERQVKTERDKVHIGMTVDEVLPLVHGGAGIRTHAVLPDNVPDEELVHYVTLMQRKDGSFGCSCGPNYQYRQLTRDEAIALMKQKMSDGYDWRWRYTFVNDTPQHFSFTVTFGPDGKVKDVTDVWGWD